MRDFNIVLGIISPSCTLWQSASVQFLYLEEYPGLPLIVAGVVK